MWFLQTKSHLRQGLTAGAAFQAQPIHHPMKWEMLVFQRFQYALASLAQYFKEFCALRYGQLILDKISEARADGQHVDKIPHYAVKFRLAPPGGCRSYDNVVLATVTVQQHLKQRQQHHVQRAVGLPRQAVQRLREALVQSEQMIVADKGLLSRIWVVYRQRQHGQIASQLALPVVP